MECCFSMQSCSSPSTSAALRRRLEAALTSSASGSHPPERAGEATFILWVIQLMNDLHPQALADPTLIMLREPHLRTSPQHESRGGAHG